jgi:hypothetical protein
MTENELNAAEVRVEAEIAAIMTGLRHAAAEMPAAWQNHTVMKVVLERNPPPPDLDETNYSLTLSGCKLMVRRIVYRRLGLPEPEDESDEPELSLDPDELR